MDVRDKVVVITGASEGIGLAAAKLFARRGAKVALVARSTDKLAALARDLPNSLAIPADMRGEADVQRMIDGVYKHFGRIDVLVNNAGQAMYGPIEKANLADYRQIMDLNIMGPLFAMQAVIPRMREHGGGIILNISSNVSKMYIPGLALYASTKYALNAISLTARTELARDNIRVGVVYPRLTATDFGKNAISNSGVNRPAGAPGVPSNLPVDSAEFVAEKILEAVEKELAEQFMDDSQAKPPSTS